MTRGTLLCYTVISVADSHEHEREKMTETIDITPPGLQTPEGIARVNEAVKAQEQAIVHVANVATFFINNYAWVIEGAAKRCANPLENGDAEEMLKDLDEVREAIKQRNAAGDEFLLALAGRTR